MMHYPRASDQSKGVPPAPFSGAAAATMGDRHALSHVTERAQSACSTPSGFSQKSIMSLIVTTAGETFVLNANSSPRRAMEWLSRTVLQRSIFPRIENGPDFVLRVLGSY
jgi:hypothetical protein